MDISSVKGRRAFISLLVDWSLCSVDRLGFDPTIRYEIDQASGDPYLEIDVHNIDASTGQVDSHTYYSQQCVGAANRLTGRHARYFTASTSRESMDKPTFLIKDVWATLDSNSASSERESTFLNVLHAEFDESSEFGGRFSQIVSTGPVHISHGDTFVADSTTTAFVGLPNVSQVRQHRRTVVQWAGKMISAADNPSQVVVAIADAMAALNAAYVKCKIFHGNISDRAILIQETTGGVKGVLADFDYASFAGDTGVEMPELMLFQSIHSLENPRATRTSLDDCESLLYLVCWLGTFGINPTQRKAFVVGPSLPIFRWNRGTNEEIAQAKRDHMANENVFYDRILSHMDENSPLRPLALDIYRVLFNYPGSYGTARISDARLAQVEDPAIATALRALPSINKKRDPYMVRNNFTDVIVRDLLNVLDRHRAAALAVLDAGEADDGSKASTPPCVSSSTKKHYMSKAAMAGPSKRPHS
ncbi:hypothetical protein FBU31_002024 [Coemansia sp. 'formosensis']|nr:hypothetical protein FBU31_002024 [Coemansia sp. 'formosensis']